MLFLNNSYLLNVYGSISYEKFFFLSVCLIRLISVTALDRFWRYFYRKAEIMFWGLSTLNSLISEK